MPEAKRSPEVESVTPYHQEGEDKGRQVAQMFDNIAPAYDFMNRAMTFGLCGWWRDKALAMLPFRRDTRVLDVATGTGDLAFRIYQRFSSASIVGVDISEGMLQVASRRLEKMDSKARKTLSFATADCLALPYPDASFDIATVAYGVRNFARLKDGLAELRRVLAPGGTLCVIELSEPVNPVVKAFYKFYSSGLIPLAGKMVSGDSRAYSYLPESIAACPQRDEMTRLMREAGFGECRWKSLTFGVVCIYIATVS